MAIKNQAPASAPEAAHPENTKALELLEIGALREKHKIDRAVFAGVCAANEWRPGKQVSEEAFLRAVDNFVGAPMGAHARRKGRK